MDSHIVLVDVGARGLTGAIAEGALEESDIIVNRNKIPGDLRSARITSGIRLGTNTVSARGMSPREMGTTSDLIDRVLTSVMQRAESGWQLPGNVTHEVRRGAPTLRDLSNPALPRSRARAPFLTALDDVVRTIRASRDADRVGEEPGGAPASPDGIHPPCRRRDDDRRTDART
jgi:hypothetical protein